MHEKTHRVGSTSALLVAACVLGQLSGCGRDGATAPPHILLITLDTARADRFSYAGASTVSTPNVDQLAGDGTVFLQAISPAPITLVAHASILTGLAPPAHGIHNNGNYRLRDEAVTITERLADHGYDTAAFVGAAVLDARYGLDQGFELYDDAMTGKPDSEFEPQRRADAVVEAALRWLEDASTSPTFAWVHLFDPHKPYDPPEPERSRHARSPYDGEIEFSDRMIGRLLDGYRQLGLYDDSIVILTSDHGEGLGEHGEPTHGIFLYDTTVHVPLIVRVPGLGRGHVVSSQVQLVDIAPTLAALTGAEPMSNVHGLSLEPLLRGELVTARPAYLETRLPLENYGWFELRGLRTEAMKLVSGAGNELYDLATDPGERNDVFAARAEPTMAMLRLLEDEVAARDELAETTELDEVTRRRLTALGYVSSGERTNANEPDTTTYRERRLSVARQLLARGFQREALERCRLTLAQDTQEDCSTRLLGASGSIAAPDRPAPREDRTQSLLASLETLASAQARDELQASLTALSAVLRNPERRSAWISQSADEPSARELRAAAVLSRTGTICFEHLDYANAWHAYLLGSQLAPDVPMFHYNLGLVWERLGDMHAALRAYTTTLELEASFGRAEQHQRFAAAVVERLDAALDR